MVAVGRLHVWDKLQHFGAYLVLSFLPVIGFRDRRRGMAAALSMFALGALLEAGLSRRAAQWNSGTSSQMAPALVAAHCWACQSAR
jgi:VanZ family protein